LPALDNRKAVNFRLLSAPLEGTAESAWTELVPHREDVTLESVHGFAGHFVLVEREEGILHLRVRDLERDRDFRLAFPDPVYTVRPGDNPEYDNRTFRFVYASLVRPGPLYHEDLASGERRLL